MGPPYHIYAFGRGEALQIFRKIAVTKLANKRLVAYQGPGGMWGMHPPPAIFNNALDRQSFSIISNLFISMGANPWRDVSPPIIRQHPPPNIFMSQNWASVNVMIFFLVFTSLWAKNWTSADVSILLNHPPNIEKWSILLNHLSQCST